MLFIQLLLQVRNKVHQDMLRPKSAMFYIDTVEEISSDFLFKIETALDKKSEVDDFTKLLHFWSLETISAIFLNTRLGCLDRNPSEDCKTLVASAKVVLGQDMSTLVNRPPL